jgi:hypothetical protein
MNVSDFVQALFVIYVGEKPMRHQNGGNRIGHKVNLHRDQEYKDNIQIKLFKTLVYDDKLLCRQYKMQPSLFLCDL